MRTAIIPHPHLFEEVVAAVPSIWAHLPRSGNTVPGAWCGLHGTLSPFPCFPRCCRFLHWSLDFAVILGGMVIRLLLADLAVFP